MQQSVLLCFVALAIYLPIGFFLATILKEKDFFQWLFLWLLITAGFFLAPDPRVCLGVVLLGCLWAANSRKAGKLAFFLLLIPVIPSGFYYQWAGFWGIKNWFSINATRMLVLFILLPIFIKTFFFKRHSGNKVLSVPMDKYVLAYLIWTFFLAALTALSKTDALRRVFLNTIDIFVPYYVFSRSINDTDAFVRLWKAVLFSSLLLAGMGIFEALIQQNIYNDAFIFKDSMHYIK
ncbi:hypothetical protein EOM81_12465, partial [bacterium]|nr:hypothetical protein [bacterium]